MSGLCEQKATRKGALTRRRFIKLCSLASLGTLWPGAAFPAFRDLQAPVRSLALHNTHTDESLQVTYWAHGRYSPNALAKINHIMRDHRTGDIKAIDTRLLDLVFSIVQNLKFPHPIHIISGYRCPRTNAMLHRRGAGTAKNSLHQYGKAVDVHLPCVGLSVLYRVARDLKGGGVGYYPRSNFVHVDVGPVRYW
ncbi:MAG: DUF882 domain-containing protein [Deltaproteobacteria bacterium]|nr:MAG: DUF882 domain-containing protein [Deltaproteobacteria bacterium]